MRTTRASRRRAFIAVAAAGALAFAACGGDESADSVATTPETAVPPSADVATDPVATSAVGTEPSGELAAVDPPETPPPTTVAAADPASEVGDDARDDRARTSSRYDDGGVDLGGAEVGAASNLETNPFPDLVVDDLNRDKQVNLRNAIPGERPVLLWFWAPH